MLIFCNRNLFYVYFFPLCVNFTPNLNKEGQEIKNCIDHSLKRNVKSKHNINSSGFDSFLLTRPAKFSDKLPCYLS